MNANTNHPTQQLVMLPNIYLRQCNNSNCNVVLYDAFMTERCSGFDVHRKMECNHVGTLFGKRWGE
tara:strand:+ start:272 stop:469 length:198 start_codon:yes stop_codon:yes gene_type:complete